MKSILTKKHLKGILSIIIIVPLGFYTKFYSGPFEVWVNNSLGGAFYEIFWCLLIYVFFIKTKPFKIVIIVFLLTCGLEFLQLWHPPFLENLRSSFILQTILGNSFNQTDFIYYFAGSLAAWLWLRLINLERN